MVAVGIHLVCATVCIYEIGVAVVVVIVVGKHGMRMGRMSGLTLTDKGVG